MNPELRQKTIQQVIRQRNPFHATPIVKLPRHERQYDWHHSQLRSFCSRLANLGLHIWEWLCKFLVIIITLLVGFLFAATIIFLQLQIARSLFNFQPTAIWQVVIEQNWRNFGGWLVISNVLFCSPYAWWGVPLAFAVRYYHVVHRRFTRQRLFRQLQATRCDDPTFLLVEIDQHPQITNRVQPSQRLIQWLENSGRVVGAITGTLSALLVCLLFIKLTSFLWQRGEPGRSIVFFIGCLAGVYLPFLLFRAYHSGQAVAAMVLDLLKGNNYWQTVWDAQRYFWAKVFENF